MIDRGWRAVVCAASGPSIDEEQGLLVSKAREDGRCRVIAVNDTWRLIPDADCLYACDVSWWRIHIETVRAGFKGECWTQSEEAAMEYLLCHVKGERGGGLSEKPDTVQHGGNSGFQAVQLAMLFGAKRIVLVGYDMKIGPEGKRHFFGDHPQPLSQGHPAHWVKYFETVAPLLKQRGVTVLNASRETALTCFPRVPLEDALAMERA